jgi:hypothetical protein
MFRETEAPPNERRRKAGQQEQSFHEGHESRQDSLTFRNAGDVEKDTAGL